MIVFAGYSNCCRTKKLKLTGYLLKQKLQEDVLIISQTGNMQVADAEDNKSYIQKVYNPNMCFDYYIISPNKYINNIPYWFYDFMNFKSFKLNKFFDYTNYKMPLMVKLFEPSGIEEIPTYQYLLTSKNEIVDIAYPEKGKYKLIVQDDKNKVIYQEIIDL